jgi:hypothetical protein
VSHRRLAMYKYFLTVLLSSCILTFSTLITRSSHTLFWDPSFDYGKCIVTMH